MTDVFFEDITEDMGGNPETERWTSVIEGMTTYRVWQDENNIIVYRADMDKGGEKEVDKDTHERVIKLLEDYDGR